MKKGTRRIALSQGKYAIVDDVDYERVSQYKWHAVMTYREGWYAVRNSPYDENHKRTIIPMHKFIMGDVLVDHRSGNGLDNRRENLRSCTVLQNSGNRRKQINADGSYIGTSKYKGVRWNDECQGWQAQIQHNKKGIYLGIFDTEIEAAHAYDNVARKLLSDFAKLNFPSGDVQVERRSKRKRKGCTSKYFGVTWEPVRAKWVAVFKNRTIGRFASEEDAAIAYDREAMRIYGKRARLNFPDRINELMKRLGLRKLSA